MKHNGERQEGARRPDEIQAEIERTRHEMDYTLTAIEQRLTPGQLVDQGIDYLRHSGANEFVQNLAGQVKYNPLPVTLVGIGLAWLMAAGKKQPDYGYGSTSYSSGLGERAGQMKDKLAESAQGVRERASSVGQATSEKLGAMRGRAGAATQSAKESISAFGTSARNQYDRAKSSADYLMREQPLALGAVGLAVGALMAALAPRTRAEDELMGETRDRLVDQAKEAGKEKLEQATQAAKASTSTPERKADSQPAGKPNVQPQRPKHGEVPTETVPPKVGADLTPRGGAGGARGTS